jgi:predicted nuclease of predicted toxin-antitoxin system
VRWLTDECVDAPLVAAMRRAGHNVLYIAESDAGSIDAEIIHLAHNEGRLLLTEDRDFGELAFRWGRASSGIVLLRRDQAGHDRKWDRLAAAIERFGDGMFGRFTVVEEARFRSRPLMG